MTRKMVRTRNTWAAYILLALYAYFLNIPGPITPFLRDEFQLSYTVTSFHFSAFAVGILVVGFFGHIVINRVGRQKALAIGALGLGAGALLLVVGRTPLVTIGGILVMGVVGSLILAVVPPFLKNEHGGSGSVAISEANSMSSLVSAAAPLLVGWFVRLMVGWRLALILGAVPVFIIGLLMLKSSEGTETHAAAVVHKSRLPKKYWVMWVGLVFAVSIEFCLIYWSADYIVQEFHFSAAGAAQSVSLFLAGMIVGRLVSSRLLRAHAPGKIISVSILLGSVGFVLYWTSPAPWLALTGLVLAGLGVASFYPVTIYLMMDMAAGNEAHAGARASLASGIAIMFLPLLLGRIADSVGLKSALFLVLVLFALYFLMMQWSQRMSSGPQDALIAGE